MEAKINNFLRSHPYYMNKSEMIRDAIRHLIEAENRLSSETIKVIENGKKQIEKGRGKTLEDVEKEMND
jgi:metal-responsive CopG/Arc/MetJ family transcriptional regulator